MPTSRSLFSLGTAALAGTMVCTFAAQAQFGVRQTPRPTPPPPPPTQPTQPGPIIIQPPTPPPINQRRPNFRSGGMNIDLINGAARNGVPTTWNPLPPRVIYPTPWPRPPIICPPPVQPCPPVWGDVPIQPLPINVGSGISIGGSWRDDRWNVGFHVGSGGAFHTRWRRNTCVAVPVWNWCNFYGSPWIGWGRQPAFGFAQGTGQYDPRLAMNGAPMLVNTQQDLAMPEQELTSFERAQVLMASDSPNAAANAVIQLRLHLRAEPEDTRAQRWLAVALLEDRRIDDAHAVMRLAYRTDPALGGEPMLPREMSIGRNRWRTLVMRASTGANANNTASGWLLLATLMQAEERQALARQMIGRARSAGLETEIAGGFN